jgi:predicted ferric reductase
MLFGLVALSIPSVRHRIHKGFYYIHVLLAITYLGLLFWHAANIMDSWAYLWATVALWLASYLARSFWYTRPLNLKSEWLIGTPTTLLKLPGGMTRIEVLAPVDFRHYPAQHCFLRFPAISLVDNHPFTIISVPQLEDVAMEGERHDMKGNTKPQILVFLARTHDGFTRKLANYVASRTDILASAWVDAPYGGVGRPIEQLYDQLILVAGGSGITACLPWLQHVVNRSCTVGKTDVRLKRVVLHWIVRDEEHFAWIENEVRDISLAANRGNSTVDTKFYVTSGSAKPRSAVKKVDESMSAEKKAEKIDATTFQSSSSERADFPGEFIYERPAMNKPLLDLESHGRSFVIGCGPEDLRTDLSNACADAQVRVLRGDIQEVDMHLEAFGW